MICDHIESSQLGSFFFFLVFLLSFPETEINVNLRAALRLY